MDCSQVGCIHCKEGIVGNFLDKEGCSLCLERVTRTCPSKGFLGLIKCWVSKFCISKYGLTLRTVSLGKRPKFA